MNFKKGITLTILLAQSIYINAQNSNLNNLQKNKVDDSKKTDKVLHAEPLYVDLIRDLGARKGEREWNLGLGMTDNLNFDSYEALVEYEWAPIDRLGFEVELPFTLYSPTSNQNTNTPSNQLNSIKMDQEQKLCLNYNSFSFEV